MISTILLYLVGVGIENVSVNLFCQNKDNKTPSLYENDRLLITKKPTNLTFRDLKEKIIRELTN